MNPHFNTNMATSRPFAYNTGAQITGTDQVGYVAIGVDALDYTSNPGGTRWFMGPDEDLGYVIAKSLPGESQDTPVSGVYSQINFERSSALTDESFIELVNRVSNQSYVIVDDCLTWLTNNGMWTSYGYGNSGLVSKIVSYNFSLPGSYVTSNTYATDLLGNSNLTFHNGIAGSTESCNESVVFDSTYNQYASMDTSISHHFTGNTEPHNTSIFMWVKISSDGVILDEINTTGWHTTNIEVVNGDLKMAVWPINNVITYTSIPFNQWKYIGFTYSGGTLTGYVDGVSFDSVVTTREAPYDGGDDLTYYFGFEDTTNLGDGGYGDFKLGTVGIWNGAIPASTVLSDYNNSVNSWVCV